MPGFLSSGIGRSVSNEVTDVSDKIRSAFTFKGQVTKSHVLALDDDDTTILQNVRNNSPDDAASHTRGPNLQNIYCRII
jgi:hypothetical protein